VFFVDSYYFFGCTLRLWVRGGCLGVVFFVSVFSFESLAGICLVGLRDQDDFGDRSLFVEKI